MANKRFYSGILIIALVLGMIACSKGRGDDTVVISWTEVTDSTFPANGRIMDVDYDGEKFIAGGQYGRMAYSPDGIKWTAITDSAFGEEDITKAGTDSLYGDEEITGIACRSVLTEFAGLTEDLYSGFRAQSVPLLSVMKAGAPSPARRGEGAKLPKNNMSVAVAHKGKIAYSQDGITWKAVTDSPFEPPIYIHDVVWGGDKFVAVGYYSRIAYSTDGENWTAVENNISGRYDIYAISYGNNRFVAGGSGGIIAYSADGINWAAVTDRKTATIFEMVYGNGRFVVGGADCKMAYSDDGINWTAVTDSPFGKDNIRAVAYGGGKFVAGTEKGKIAYSTDGENWTAIADIKLRICNIAYGSNRFVAVCKYGRIFYSSGL